MAKISVLGAGSWGMAISILLTKNGHDVTIWSFSKEEEEKLKKTRENENRLPGVILPDSVEITSDDKRAVYGADLVVVAVPSIATRSTAERFAVLLKGKRVVTLTKGIEEKTLKIQTEILEEFLGHDTKIAVLSGPSHAEEVAILQPTVVVVGSKDKELAKYCQEIFMNEVFRVYISPDVVGIEIGASLKNVIALAAGMSDGLGFGDNAKAALITRGIKEISNLAIKMGGKAETLSGLSGIGDLIVTCESHHSRNRNAGFYIGQGMTAKEAMDKVSMVVEGVYSAKAAKALGEKYNLELPIIDAVNRVLFEDASPRKEVIDLMNREKKSEISEGEWK